jgi:hypothetical protein
VSTSVQNLFQRIGHWFALHEAAVAWTVFLGVLALYLAFPTRNYYWDGITFAHAIEQAKHLISLIHPNHLLYNLLGYVFYHLLHTVGFNVRAIAALQILNAVLSATAAVVFFVTLKSILRSLYLATFLALLFALSATWWKFSSDGDAYIISVLLLLIAFHFILPNKKSQPLLVGVLYSASMCFHQLAIFFGPVIVLGLLYQSGKANAKQKFLNVLQFGLVSFGLTAAVYFYCFYITTHSLEPGRFLRWFTSYSPDASFTFNFWDDLGYTLRGHARLFLNGRFNLIKGLISPIVIILLGLLVIDFCLLCYLVFKNFHRPSLRTLRTLLRDPQGRPLLMLSTAWLFIYVVFLFVWLPQNTFYRLFYLPSLIIIAGLLAWARNRAGVYQPTYRLLAFTIAVGLANFLFLIFPYSHAEKFPPTRFALEMSQQWTAKTLIYYDLENSDKNLISYFSPAASWIQLRGPDTLENQLSDLYEQGWTVWLETTAIDRLSSTPGRAEWLAAHAKKDSLREVKDKGFRIEFVQVVP